MKAVLLLTADIIKILVKKVCIQFVAAIFNCYTKNRWHRIKLEDINYQNYIKKKLSPLCNTFPYSIAEDEELSCLSTLFLYANHLQLITASFLL